MIKFVIPPLKHVVLRVINPTPIHCGEFQNIAHNFKYITSAILTARWKTSIRESIYMRFYIIVFLPNQMAYEFVLCWLTVAPCGLFFRRGKHIWILNQSIVETFIGNYVLAFSEIQYAHDQYDNNKKCNDRKSS